MDSKIKNIIFDLGGVILDIDFYKTQNAFRSLGLHEIEDLFGLGHAASYFKDYEVGKINDEEFINNIRKSVSEELSPDEIIKAWNAMLIEFPKPGIEKIKELKLKYRTFLFSNTNAIHLKAFRKMFEADYPGETLDGLFEKVYYSHLMKARKPDVASFIQIINENNLIAEETLFVDDAEINLKAAREAGLQTFLINGNSSILDLN